MEPAVTVSLVDAARGGPFVFWDDLPAACRQAAEIGFPAIELFAPGPDAVPAATLQSLLDSHQLKLAAVGTGAGWLRHKLSLTSPDESVRRGAVQFIQSMIEFGGRHGAPAIIGSMQGRHGDSVSPPQALDWLRASLDELGAVASRFHVPLLYEPLNRYESNLCNTLAAGLSLIQSLQTDRVRLQADLFHQNIEETDVADAVLSTGSWIGHLHFVDSNRRAAGFGHTDFRPIVRALRHVGYQGYLSAEAFPWPDSFAAAKQTFEAVEYWKRIAVD
jgi:sugar phosphate isomerase/epimerase